MARKVTRGKRWELIRPGETPAPEPEYPPRDRQSPRVSLEKRAMARVVTVVSGLLLPAAERKALAKTLKAACGAGGTVTDEGIEIQGDHREAVRIALRSEGFR